MPQHCDRGLEYTAIMAASDAAQSAVASVKVFVEVAGVRLWEPVTSLTDVMLGLSSLVHAARLPPSYTSINLWWTIFFCASAYSATVAGSFHLMGLHVDDSRWESNVWASVLIAIGMATLAIEQVHIIFLSGNYKNERKSVGRELLELFVWVQFLTLAGVILAGNRKFFVVVASYGPTLAMLTLIVLGSLACGRGYDKHALKALLRAELISILGAVVQAFGPDLHPHFNHNDLFHMVQIWGNWEYFRAARATIAIESPVAQLKGTKGL